MCGIAGGLSRGAAGPSLAETVRKLTDDQARRGPDGEGFWTDETHAVSFGHRRLAIVDVGQSGAQPMMDAAERYVITFNGEIYNHCELRADLTACGRVFRTRSDTEVIIQAVAQWGEAGLARLRGMFAFALWDRQERELWLARDPFGIKPLYVAQRDGRLWFASQARGLARHAPVDVTRDPAALVGFYIWGHVPEPFTWWSGIRMFPAGHVQRLRPDRPETPPRPFYDLGSALVGPAHRAPLSVDALRTALRDSVSHHLVSDVPVGVFLSSGIDSGVLATQARACTSHLRTLTLAFSEFEGLPQDEAPAAEALARELGTEHVTVRIDRGDFEATLDDFILSMDQPSIDGLNTYLVSRAAAAQGLKVALSGLGADELFGGYPSFREIPRLLALGRRMPLRPALGHVLDRLGRNGGAAWFPPKLFGVLKHAGGLEEAYLLRRSLYLTGELDALLDESWLTRGLVALGQSYGLPERDLVSSNQSVHAQIAMLETRCYMRNQLLRDTDWASMAHGLEVRVPFLDIDLLQRIGPALASSTPPQKADLAEAGGLSVTLARRPKTGFTTPVRSWIGANSARGLRGWAGQVHAAFRGDLALRPRQVR